MGSRVWSMTKAMLCFGSTGPDEEMPGLRDLDVLAKPDAERERIAVEVRQKTRQRSSRGVGLHRRPLASQARDLCGEGPERVPVEDRSRNQAAGRRHPPR